VPARGCSTHPSLLRLNEYPRSVLSRSRLNTDQGSEYTAGRFRGACQRLGIRQSMGRPGSALDNAVIESWHSTLEFELRRAEEFADKAAARAGVAAWIEDYNHERRHSALGMLSPVDYERSLTGKDAA
jgi:putative transposase